ncbi:CO dehydrogenase accessory protein CooC (nickel insertion) [Lachnospiraceae bacterium TWA4]|nr:CO dehydrogenase accessory protein CooC (nickel insertion) [Lachnospiraceae bacterium TWA4]
MSHLIAVAGKGGTGKTTTCGMMIDYLCQKNQGPVLAVDADANSNLNEVLGVKVEATLGSIREEIAHAELQVKSPIPPGMSKQDYANWKFNDALVEEDDYDMLVMGRGQGTGCYCFVNDLLRGQIVKLAQNYKYVVVDNEAGLEHISRGTLPHMDTLLLVSDCSRRGIQAVGRVARMVEEMKLNPKTVKLIVNRAPGGVLNDGIKEEIANQGLDLVGVIPQDETIYEYDCDGKATSQVPDDNPVKMAVRKIMEDLGF